MAGSGRSGVARRRERVEGRLMADSDPGGDTAVDDLPFAIAVPPDPTDAERAERVKAAQQMVRDAEAYAAANPPPPPVRHDDLHVVGVWKGDTTFGCKLCAFSITVHPGLPP